MTAPTCERHGVPLTRVDNMPDGGRRWRCLADGDRCLSSYWEPAPAWPDQPASADTAGAALEEPGANWRPARDGDTPGQCDPEHGPAQPIDLEPHHARGRERTDEERAALKARVLVCASRDDLRRAANKVRQAMRGADELTYATGGAVRSWPAIVGEMTR